MSKFKDFLNNKLKRILYLIFVLLSDIIILYAAFFVVKFPATLLVLFITVPILVPFNYIGYYAIKELFQKDKKDEQS